MHVHVRLTRRRLCLSSLPQLCYPGPAMLQDYWVAILAQGHDSASMFAINRCMAHACSRCTGAASTSAPCPRWGGNGGGANSGGLKGWVVCAWVHGMGQGELARWLHGPCWAALHIAALPIPGATRACANQICARLHVCVQILKKHDKRTGFLLRAPYLANVLLQVCVHEKEIEMSLFKGLQKLTGLQEPIHFCM